MTADLPALLDRVFELSHLVAGDVHGTLHAQGLTVARTHLLWVLEKAGPSTQQHLAAALEVTPRNVTGLVDALAATGFVTREAHPTDRRATLVTLTPLGRTTMSEMSRQHDELAGVLFGDIPADELQTFTTTLDIVIRRVTDEIASAGATPVAAPSATRERSGGIRD